MELRRRETSSSERRPQHADRRTDDQVSVTSRDILPIEGIAHLDNDKHRQRARLGFGGVEYVAVHPGEHSGLGRALHMMCLTTSY